MLSLQRFFAYYLLFSTFIAGIALALQYQFYPNAIAKNFWVAYIFIAGITLIAYLLGHFGLKNKPETATFALLGSIVVKLLLSMCFVLIYSLKASKNEVVFMLDFFSLYLFYTAFEIYALLCNLRHPNLK